MKTVSPLTGFTLYILTALILASCSSTPMQDRAPSSRENPKEVDTSQQSREYRGVVINQAGGQLYQPVSTQALDLPPRLRSSSKDSPSDNGNAGASSYKVLPAIEGARIINEGDRQWVEVDSALDEAWAIMEKFWESSGIGLVENSLDTGIMDTEWIQSPKDVVEAESAAMRFARSLSTSLTQRETVLNRFRLRFEQLNGNATRVHVSHRWVARKEREKARKTSEFKWSELPSDPERIADFLQNMVLLFDK